MAEASEPVPSSSKDSIVLELINDEGPLAKKPKLITDTSSEKLEHRLGGILCCAVCLDLPPAAVYQCSNGHLMCAPCFTHLLADARLRDETATCPHCRVEISKASASRNLAVEKTVSELPSECKHCKGVYPRHSLLRHEENTCEDRIYKFSQILVEASDRASMLDSLVRMLATVYWLVWGALDLPRSYFVKESGSACRRRYRRVTTCRFSCIGCTWRGPAHEAGGHEAQCPLPERRAADVVPALRDCERRARADRATYDALLDLLSYEKIMFNDLQLKPYRTEEFVHKLYYETSRFSAFGHQWVVKAFVNKNQRDPTQSTQREITYQVILKSKPTSPVPLQWVWVRGPFGEAGVRVQVAAHQYREDETEGPHLPLPLADRADTNRLLAGKAIHLRLIMFLSSK